MSTKLYTGFRFKSGMSLLQIHKHIMKFRKEAQGIVREEVSKWLAKRSVAFFDSQTLKKLEGELKEQVSSDGSFLVAYSELRQRKRELDKSSYRDTEIDFTFELSILPFGGRVLGLYFGENKRLIDVWMGKSFISEYHYQNSADRPEDISASEWRQRARDWDRVLVGSGIPAQCGFTATIVEKYYPLVTPQECLLYIPKLEDRAKPFAEGSLLKGFMQEQGKSEELSVGEWSSVSFAFRDWLRTLEGRKAYEKEARKVKGKLKRRISKADLLRG